MSDNDTQQQPDGPNPWVRQLMIWGGIFLALLLVVTLFSNAGQTPGAAIRYSDFRSAVADTPPCRAFGIRHAPLPE